MKTKASLLVLSILFPSIILCMFSLTSCGGGGDGGETIIFNEVENVTPDIVAGTWIGSWASYTGFSGGVWITMSQDGNTISGNITVEDGGVHYDGVMNGTLQGNDLLFGSAFGICTINYVGNIFVSVSGGRYILKGDYTVATGGCHDGTFQVEKQ